MKITRRQLVPWLSTLLCIGMSPAQEATKKQPVPLATLPNLTPPARLLALVEAKDHEGLMRLYLANTTSEQISGAVFGLEPAFKEAFVAAVREVLAKPWDRIRDDRNRLEICLNALSRAGLKKHPVGDPARYPAMVWRYLSIQSKLRMADEYCINPERWQAIEALKASGNDWEASAGDLASLGILAEKSVRSTNEKEAKAARPFLRFSVAHTN
jgi:hypothetical protein